MTPSSPSAKRSSPRDVIEDVCRDIHKITGIQLGERQRSMVESRLKKRALDLGISELEDYLAYYLSNRDAESAPLVSLLTTHHTFFFREFLHFEYLERGALEKAVTAARKRGDKKIRVWSAATSRGHESYSLSMFLFAHLARIAPDFSYEIVGTDVDPESIRIAKNGVYSRNETKSVPMLYFGNHWAKGTGEIEHFVKAKSSIKAPCKFEVANLLKFPASWTGQKFDLIFCRNVFIYFTPQQIQEITERLIKHLHPTGMLFIGISESLSGLGLNLKSVGPSIYMFPQPEAAATIAVAPQSSTPTAVEEIIKVLCVDDSPSVLTLLKQILKREHGFEVVATAKNGIEAEKTLHSVKADVMTLDIHMPELDGPGYLKKYFSKTHPPVVMISSVSRDDANLALSCLTAGASDYVEKPALTDIHERGDEIRTKLRCAFRAASSHIKRSPELDKEFASEAVITAPESKRRVVVFGLSHQDQVVAMIRELNGAQPPTYLLIEGAGNLAADLVPVLSSKSGVNIKRAETLPSQVNQGEIFVLDAKHLASLVAQIGSKLTSVLVYGEVTPKLASAIFKLPKKEILIEDTGSPRRDNHLVSISNDTVPATSFAYMSTHYLSKSSP